MVCVLESMCGIVLDIGGYGIKGFCSFDDWSELGSSIIKPWLVKPGTVVYVRVVKRMKRQSRDSERYARPLVAGGYRCVRKGGAYLSGEVYNVGDEVVCTIVQNREWGGFAYIETVADAAVMIRAKGKKRQRYECYEKYLVKIEKVNDINERIRYVGTLVEKLEEEKEV